MQTHFCKYTVFVPALLHAQTDTGGFTGLRCRDMMVFWDLLVMLLELLCGDVSHAENTGLYVETLSHFWAGVLHGHYGYLAHLVCATCNLSEDLKKTKTKKTKNLLSQPRYERFHPVQTEYLSKRYPARKALDR